MFGAKCYQKKDDRLVGDYSVPTGRYLLFKTGCTYIPVGVGPLVCNSSTLEKMMKGKGNTYKH